MATRQHRRKKGLVAQDSKERTVTTSSEDPNSSLLVPTPSEQAAISGVPMSSPFSVASSSGGHNTTSTTTTTPNGNYQPGNFSYSNYSHGNGNGASYDGTPIHPQQHQQFDASVPLPTMPPGRNDLEILEKLKAQIKAGQHERFQPRPAPSALLKLYQDGIKSQAAPHPLQGPDGNAIPGHHYDVRSAASSESGPKISPAHDPSHRVPTIHTLGAGNAYDPKRYVDSPTGVAIKSNPVTQGGTTHGNPSSNSVPPSPLSKLDPHKPVDSKSSLNGSASSGPDTAQYSHNRYSTASALDSNAQDSKIDRLPPNEGPAGEYSSRPRTTSDTSSTKTPFQDGKTDSRPPPARDSWQPSDGLPARDDPRARPGPDRIPPPPLGRPLNTVDQRPPPPGDSDIRGAPPRDQRFLDRERNHERDSERERGRDWERDRERRPEYRRDERPGDRPGGLPADRARVQDMRRPPPEERHYEPRYASDMIPRRSDPRSDDLMDVDKRLPPPARHPPVDDRSVRPPPVDARRPSSIDDHSIRPPRLDDRSPPPRPSVDDRALPPRVTSNDVRPARVISAPDEHHARTSSNDNRHNQTPDDRGLRPLPPSQSQDIPPRLAADRGAQRAPVPPLDDRSARPPVSLEDRIGRPPPSLQERIAHPSPAARPPPARAEDRLSRPPSLEERLAHPPIHPSPGGDRAPPRDDRDDRPGPNDRIGRPVESIKPLLPQSRLDDRSVRPPPPGDRYDRPVSPALRGPGNPAPRSVSAARDDPRSYRPPSPVREYRPPRPPSRERDLRPAHRPESDRAFEERRPNLMDTDPPSRFNENRAPYMRRPSPPPVVDRTRSVYPPPPSPKRGPEPLPYSDTDRRYPADTRRDWPLDGKARPSSGSDEEYYKARSTSASASASASWDREALDRDRVVERGAPPSRNNGWETREERERRGSFPAATSPSMRPFESAPARPPASRLSDTYSASVEDRAYPPKDYDRAHYPPSAEPPVSFSRVRPRSPSPMARRPPLPGNVVDDGRPPMKRAREDAPYSGRLQLLVLRVTIRQGLLPSTGPLMTRHITIRVMHELALLQPPLQELQVLPTIETGTILNRETGHRIWEVIHQARPLMIDLDLHLHVSPPTVPGAPTPEATQEMIGLTCLPRCRETNLILSTIAF
ncbi:hypothetical protein HWV62_38837 [Athelia sp. TMB]|nr:hypothetical protein HWV62_38837 [Athelia sp. TMB]